MNMTSLAQEFYTRMSLRMGEQAAAQRLKLQVEHSAELYGKGFGKIHLENIEAFITFVDIMLRISGMRSRGRRNSLDFRVEENAIEISDLAPDLEGFKILQLTDIHVDGFIDGGEALFTVLDDLEYDLCVLTGDYRLLTHHSYTPSSIGMNRLIKHIHCQHGTYAILGNHDFLEQVHSLEESGIKVLLNENSIIRHGESEIFIAGVDDPHFYGSHDLDRAFSSRPDNTYTILLSHSPELYAEAAEYNTDLYICGHTHGGQICLPGGFPVITHANCPRAMTSGSWQYKNMSGYTSRGTGCSGVQARFNCPPEISMHILYSKADENGDI
ncbi:metallophosphoesterase [Maridesulfovibrio zosterae]|uniref:metallophosphoesterase n=1 Tax=Maridesulfovibrio zosterae TaxID=82171 RepID=UPI0003FBD709|nr:metallophosphoesterase [Maridesulfovibrio zosterae]